MSNLETEIQKAIDHLKSTYANLQIGRASTTLVEDIQVQSYGAMMALKASANISCPDTKTIKVEPWDKSILAGIETAIINADLDLNPQNTGDAILLPIPPMTEERRSETAKKAKELAENAKIALRNERQGAMKDIKRRKDDSEISEDEQRQEEKTVQDQVDKGNQTIDEMAKKKEQEIMTV